MRTTMKLFYRTAMDIQQPGLRLAIRLSLLLGLALHAPATVRAADDGRAFPTPEAAVTALCAAANANDRDALHNIFGSAEADIENPDQAQAAADLQSFSAALNRTNRLVHES